MIHQWWSSFLLGMGLISDFRGGTKSVWRRVCVSHRWCCRWSDEDPQDWGSFLCWSPIIIIIQPPSLPRSIQRHMSEDCGWRIYDSKRKQCHVTLVQTTRSALFQPPPPLHLLNQKREINVETRKLSFFFSSSLWWGAAARITRSLCKFVLQSEQPAAMNPVWTALALMLVRGLRCVCGGGGSSNVFPEKPQQRSYFVRKWWRALDPVLHCSCRICAALPTPLKWASLSRMWSCGFLCGASTSEALKCSSL